MDMSYIDITRTKSSCQTWEDAQYGITVCSFQIILQYILHSRRTTSLPITYYMQKIIFDLSSP